MYISPPLVIFFFFELVFFSVNDSMWRLESQDVLLIHRYVIFKSGCYHKSSKIFCWLATFFYFIKLVSSPVIYDSNVNMFYFVECVFELETLKWEGGMQLLQSWSNLLEEGRYSFIGSSAGDLFIYLILQMLFNSPFWSIENQHAREKNQTAPQPPPLKKKQQT